MSTIECGGYHSVGLKEDGTSNIDNQCDLLYLTFTNIKLPYIKNTLL